MNYSGLSTIFSCCKFLVRIRSFASLETPIKRQTMLPAILSRLRKVRINHKNRGMVLYKACNQMKEWQKKYPQLTGSVINIKFPVNNSFIRILWICSIKSSKKNGLKPESICLEISETVLIENHYNRVGIELLHEKVLRFRSMDFDRLLLPWLSPEFSCRHDKN
jgi:hypothetical protein